MMTKMNPRTPSEKAGSPDSTETLDRRSETRVQVDIPARLKCLNPLISTGPSASVRIIEVSYHGMKLRVGRELLVGGLVQIIVSNKILMGKVRHVKSVESEFEVGIHLTERIPSSLV